MTQEARPRSQPRATRPRSGGIGRVRRLIWQRDFSGTWGRCVVCETKLERDAPGWHVGHIIPRQCGGTDHEDNLVVICRSCNRSQQRRTLLDMKKRAYPASCWSGARRAPLQHEAHTRDGLVWVRVCLFGAALLTHYCYSIWKVDDSAQCPV